MSERGEHRTETCDATTFGVALSEPRNVDGTPYIVVPAGFKVENLEGMQSQPTRIREKVTLNDEASFIGYWHRFANVHSMLFAQLPPVCTFAAAFDYHALLEGIPDPSWCTHRAAYTCNTSVAWGTWTAKDGHWMTQTAFAEFIEDNLPDIFAPADEPAAPGGADMLELARDLQAHKQVNFASSVRLSSGAHSLTYVEEIKGSSRKGTLDVPENFYLLLPPFVNGEAYKVRARFRYRIDEGNLKLRYDLHRPHEAIYTRIAAATKTAILNGQRG